MPDLRRAGVLRLGLNGSERDLKIAEWAGAGQNSAFGYALSVTSCEKWVAKTAVARYDLAWLRILTQVAVFNLIS